MGTRATEMLLEGLATISAIRAKARVTPVRAPIAFADSRPVSSYVSAPTRVIR